MFLCKHMHGVGHAQLCRTTLEGPLLLFLHLGFGDQMSVLWSKHAYSLSRHAMPWYLSPYVSVCYLLVCRKSAEFWMLIMSLAAVCQT